MQKLYFIRHGLSVANSLGKLNGLGDSPLSDVGRKQAKLAGQNIKELDIDTIVSSSLSRSLETATIIAEIINYPKKDIKINKLFNERDFGQFEGHDYKTIIINDRSDIEPIESVIYRAHKALNFLNQLKARNVLVVSHGSFGRALRYHALNYPYDHSETFKNAEVVRLI